MNNSYFVDVASNKWYYFPLFC